MDLLGNESLLDRPLVALFASRDTTPEATILAKEWAYKMIESKRVIISGFHSPAEREVLKILLEADHPVIIALGRALYKRMPASLQEPYNKGLILFVSFRNNVRSSLSNSQLRNWATADLAQEVVFAPFPPSSQLSTLHYTLSKGATTKTTIL